MHEDKLLNRLIAHRGGKFYGLENTKEAFEAAIKLNYYGIECDIQPTKDKKLVVYHDLDLFRLANIDKKIIDCDLEDLKDLILSKLETDKKTYKGKIMLFNDFLDLVKRSKIKAFIEIKESFTIEYIQVMMDTIQKSEIDNNQIIIIANKASFHLLKDIRKLNNEVKLQFVAYTDYTKYIDDCLEYKIDLDLSKNAFFDNKEQFIINIKRFHQCGLEINCWVVDDLKLLEELEIIGIDYITTDSLRPVVKK
jgi:glycerophosphoryl diester phosphodiesterase